MFGLTFERVVSFSDRTESALQLYAGTLDSSFSVSDVFQILTDNSDTSSVSLQALDSGSTQAAYSVSEVQLRGSTSEHSFVKLGSRVESVVSSMLSVFASVLFSVREDQSHVKPDSILTSLGVSTQSGVRVGSLVYTLIYNDELSFPYEST